MLRKITFTVLLFCLALSTPVMGVETGRDQSPAISADLLTSKSRQRLMEIAADVKGQRQSMAEFEAYVAWMTANLSGYSRYIKAGSIAAGFVRVLPIPYAGQASVLAKFISQGILALNAASVSLNRYLVTSKNFIARVDGLDRVPPAERPAEIANLSRLADEGLKRDMTDARTRLRNASELSASTLSFLESLNHYLGSGEEYWNKTKTLLSGKNPAREEQGYLAQSMQNLRNRAAVFNSRLRNFETTTEKDEYLITSLTVYRELIREAEAGHRTAANRAGAGPGT